MIWQEPLFLLLLTVIPLLTGGLWWYNRKRRQRREQFFSDDLFGKLRQGFWSLGDRIKSVSLYIGLAFLVIALAGPKVGTEVKEVKRQGVDLLIALDLSASMNAEDVKPSRLEKAKYEISRLVDRLKGDRVGLIIFTGDAYLQAPMTLDYSALRLFLNIAGTDQMPNSATDFSAALEAAGKAFDSAEKQNSNTKAAKVMLIISDGENHGESYEEALQEIREQNISVYTLGIGTRNGGTIPLYNEQSNLLGYKRNEEGNVITTTLEPDVLQDIAQQGNGEYYEIQAGNDGIDAFLARLDDLQQGEFASQEYADFKNQYQWLAGIGLVFLMISLGFSEYKRRE
jgi:Ca-activated chloride channel family protein